MAGTKTRSKTGSKTGSMSASRPTSTGVTKPTKKPTKKPSKKPSKKPPSPPSPSPSPSSSPPPSFPPSTVTPQKNPFHLLPEGSGLTLSLPPHSPITHLGTLHCNTCVGLYVPISPTRAFLAHFNLEPLRPNGQPYKRQVLKNYEINPPCYRAVVMLTKEFLTAAQWKGGWGKITQEMAEGMKMVCPNVGVGGKLYTGDAVVEGVREFFGGWSGGGEVSGGENIIVGYPVEGGEGEEPVVVYPDGGELEERWVGVEVGRNDEFACADFRKDGKVWQGDGLEGPYPPV